MSFFGPLDVIAHPAVVAPKALQYTEVAPVSDQPTLVAPVSVPNYLSGATILLVLAGMVGLAARAAGFTSTIPKQRIITAKNSSDPNQRTSALH